MEEITQTEQEEEPPSPPRPQVPVEVPNHAVIEDQEINLDTEMDMDQKLEMPDSPGEEEFFMAVQNMSQIKGGQEWLYDNIDYPEQARKAGVEEQVIVQFVVNKKGQAQNLKILRGIGGGGGYDEAALDVIKKAEFTPGRQRSTIVPVKMSQPVVFKLKN
jgi:protein TonB